MASKFHVLMSIRHRICTCKPDATKEAENRNHQTSALIPTLIILYHADHFKTKLGYKTGACNPRKCKGLVNSNLL